MAKRASKVLLDTSPLQTEMLSVLADLRLESDASLAITGLAYVESAALAVLRAKFVPLSREDDARMFDGASNGVLGTASAKFRMLHALGVLSDRAYQDLMLLNHVRNVFAHSLHKVKFDNSLIAEDCAKLEAGRHFRVQRGAGQSIERIQKEFEPKKAFYDAVFTLFGELLAQLALLGKLPSLDAAWPGTPRQSNPHKAATRPSQSVRPQKQRRPRGSERE